MPVSCEIDYLPFESSALAQGVWLVLAPHPDDETFGMGGCLLLAKQAKITVDVIFLTDGSASDTSDTDLINKREQEAIAACQQLGIRSTLFWRETDRQLKSSQHLINKLSAFISQNHYTHVFFPSPQEPHPDHRVTSVIAWESLRHANFSAIPISYEISQQAYTNQLIDISSVVTEKEKIMAIYISQLADNHYIERILGLNQARAWSLPLSVSHAEAFYYWPIEDRPLNALLLSLATEQSSLQALPQSLPLVSVITRTQNRPEFLRAAIRSVASQTYPNIELVVVNDGGINCKSLVKEEATGHIQQINYQQIKTQSGRSHAANIGLNVCQGEFIIFLDDDDWFLPEHIERLVDSLTQDPTIIATYSAVQCIDDNGEKTKQFAEKFDPIQLCIDNFIPIHAVLFRNNVLSQGCTFNEQLDFCEDWDFWLQLNQQGAFKFIDQTTAIYRMQSLASGIWDDTEKTQQTMLNIYRHWLTQWDDKTIWAIFEYARCQRQIAEQQHIINDKEQELTSQQQAIIQLEQIVHNKEQELTNQQLSISEQQQIIDNKEQELTNQQLSITQQQQFIDDKEQELTEQQHAITHQQQIIDSKGQELTAQQSGLNQQQTRLEEQDQFISQQQQAIQVLNNQLLDAQQQFTTLENTLNAVYSSTSWFITKPIRFLKQLLLQLTNLSFKDIGYFCWSMTPLTLQQRITIKKVLTHWLPTVFPVEESPLPDPIADVIAEPMTEDIQANTTKHSDEYQHRFSNAINQSNQDYVPLAGDHIDQSRNPVKVIAFFLPQFHPIAENNREWGLGFTEWTNVSKAVPQFVGHYQPRLPGELGFYDLRLKEIQQRQIELAKQYGVHGFCYHHYWFAGQKVLEKPFQQILNDPTLDLPFCLCWANENWTRRWDGGDNDIILAQQHSPEDDIAFIKDILPALQDKRYIRVNGKPLLIIYRPSLLPDPKATAQRWRDYCIKAGLGDLHLVVAATFGFDDYTSIGYDGLVQFPPHNIEAPEITEQMTLLNNDFKGHVYDFKQFSQRVIDSLKGKSHVFPCVMMNWDNEARKSGSGFVFQHASPKNYKHWLKQAFDYVLKHNDKEEQVVFINAWNEWAEGTYLEPDRHYGYAYLHATANTIKDYYNVNPLSQWVATHNQSFKKTNQTALVIHIYYFDLMDEILTYINQLNTIDIIVTLPDHADMTQVNQLVERIDNVYISLQPNKGRDILPFLSVLKQVVDLNYDYLVKVHTKKSTHRQDGNELRKETLDNLLKQLTVQHIVHYFEQHPDMGLIAPTSSVLSLATDDYLVFNKTNLTHCLQRLKHDSTPLDFDFIAGSMFWARVDAITPIFQLNLTAHDFADELGQIDGTMAHAVERLFCYFASTAGYKTTTIEQITPQ